MVLLYLLYLYPKSRGFTDTETYDHLTHRCS